MEIVHTPVLLKECLEFLSPSGESYEKNPWMCDSTLGEGGHTNAFLEKFPELNVIGLDASRPITFNSGNFSRNAFVCPPSPKVESHIHGFFS